MKTSTIRKRIFISNTVMVLLILALMIGATVGCVKLYTDHLEERFVAQAQRLSQKHGELDEHDLKSVFFDNTIKNPYFNALIGADLVICVAGLLVISQIFTRRLSNHLMVPVEALEEGAERVRKGNFNEKIVYHGEKEFENLCDTFNLMQAAILEMEEKRTQYEQMRTNLIVGISHDLRTPLTAIRGTVKGLLDGVADTPEMQQQFLKIADRRAEEMEKLLRRLFYFSKMETGSMPVTLQRLDLRDFVKAYVKGKQEVLDPQCARLEMVSGETESHFPVQIDGEQMERIFDNLIENSIKYAGKQPVHIYTQLKMSQDDEVMLSVWDDGRGVSKENLPHLFEEFYREDASRNQNQKEGNGLGLYIVKYLTEAMGGTVTAENVPGLQITLHLPLAGEINSENAKCKGENHG
jgi:signal transduction histidine kinase